MIRLRLVHESNNVLQAAQTNQTLFIKLGNKRNVLWYLTECLTEIKLHKTSSNIVKHGGQTSKTCFIKQCWIMFYSNVLLIWTGADVTQQVSLHHSIVEIRTEGEQWKLVVQHTLGLSSKAGTSQVPSCNFCSLYSLFLACTREPCTRLICLTTLLKRCPLQRILNKMTMWVSATNWAWLLPWM